MSEYDPSDQDEAVYQRYLDFNSLVTGGRLVPNWMPDGSSFWYVQGDPNDRQILKLDPKTNDVAPLFDAKRLRSALGAALGHEPAGKGMPFEQFRFVEASKVSFALQGTNFELDLYTYKLTRTLPPSSYSLSDLVRNEAERVIPGTFMREKFQTQGEEPSPAAASPDGRWLAMIEDKNLVLRATVDGHQVKLTHDGTPLVFWDVEGAQWNPWSPDGLYLAVFKHHTECMTRLPTIEWLKPREHVRQVIALHAGDRLYRSELYFVDMYSQKPRAVDLGDTTNQYLRILSWLPAGSQLILARYNRVLSRVEIQAVNALTGATQTILVEESPTFLTNHHKALWGTETGFTMFPDGSGFIWNSERSGWDHLDHYDIQGRLLHQLTSGDWRVKDVVRVDQKGGWVYFTGHGDRARPYDTHLYRVGLDGEGLAQLTEGKGQHTIHLSPSARYFTDTYSGVDMPPKTVLRKADGTLIRTLCEADIGRLQTLGWVAPLEHVVKAADGKTDLWVTLYFPYNFDPGKKYPVVEYIYAGPQAAVRPMDFGDQAKQPDLARQANFNRALAHLGFIVLTLDARGTPGRSKSFHDTVYRNWGQFEIEDHAGALRQLAGRLPFLDLDRVGIWGRSWGGHFAFRALTQAPDLYKAGICEMPGFDSRRFTLYEPYLGMPQENKSGYDAADAFALAPKLKGEVLLIGGMNDTGTQADLFKMSEILIRLGKQHGAMSYPYCEHKPVGKTAEYNLELKKRFFLRHLR